MKRLENHISWLHKEIPQWKQEGIIDEATSNKLEERYQHQLSSQEKGNTFLVVFGTIASLLIGTGIISLFATNWDFFNQTQKVIVSFIPLVISASLYLFTYLKKGDSMAWKESVSILVMLSFGASLGLISQVYHISGDLGQFLTVWLLSSVPLIYLYRSYAVFLIYVVFATVLLFVDWRNFDLVRVYLIPLLALPFYYLQLKHERLHNKTFVSSWLLPLAYGLMVLAKSMYEGSIAFLMIVAFSFFLYLLGQVIYSKENHVFKTPLKIYAYLVVIILAYCYTFVDLTESIVGGWELKRDILELHLHDQVKLVVFVGLGILLLVKCIKQGIHVNPFLAVTPLLFFLPLVVTRGEEMLITVIFCVYLFALGIYLIAQGVNNKSMLHLNVGMLVVCAMILSKFFEVDVSLTVKGIVSIVMGMCFLATNVVLSKNLKSTNHAK